MRISLRRLDRTWVCLLAIALTTMVATTLKDAAQADEAFVSAVSPQSVYHEAWRVISSTYVDPSFNGQDWSAWEHKFDGKLENIADAKAAIRTMAASLGDRYTRVAQTTNVPTSIPSNGAQASHTGTTDLGPAVSSMLLADQIGYIKISTFSTIDISKNLKTALEQFNSTKGLVLDLRGNRGGLVANALEAADMLLDSGKIMTSMSRAEQHSYRASGMPINQQPMVVLVDENSASASEILAGALHDNHRAVIMGSKTFGKGLIQEVTNLTGGLVLYVTTAKYVTPNGTDINSVGIEPNIQATNDAKEITLAADYLKSH